MSSPGGSLQIKDTGDLCDTEEGDNEDRERHDEVTRQLEIKMEELSRKMRHIEELCNMTDPLTVLQESDTGGLCDTEEGDNEDRERYEEELYDGGDLDVAGISHTLHTELSEIQSDIKKRTAEEEELLDILLDVTTAGNHLHISDDGKNASWSDRSQNHPDTPERFLYDQVMSRQSFSSGRHYWEVAVGETGSGRVGMCYPSIDRRGQQSMVGYNDKNRSQDSHTARKQQISELPQHVDILLDVTTASNFVNVSGDCKKACWTYDRQCPQETLIRFQHYPQVLSKRRLSSGQHYWEVDVSKSYCWRVGMCYPSIEKEGRPQSLIGASKKSWCLVMDGGQCSARHDEEQIHLPNNIYSNIFRIYLDYKAGQISFYELCDTFRHLHTFTATFTEPLHAALCVWEGSVRVLEARDLENLPFANEYWWYKPKKQRPKIM